MAKKAKLQKNLQAQKHAVAKKRQAAKKMVDQPVAGVDEATQLAVTPLQTVLDLRYCVEAFKQSAYLVQTYISQSLLFFAVPSLLLILGTTLVGDNTSVATPINDRIILGSLCTLLGGGWLILNGLTSYYFMLKVGYRHQFKLSQIYRHGLRFVPRILGFMILFALFFIIAFFAFVIPAFIVLRRYYLAPFYIIDYDCGIRDAMRLSAEQTKPRSYKVYSVLLFILAITIVAGAIQKYIVPYGSIVSIVASTIISFMPLCLYMSLQADVEAAKKVSSGQLDQSNQTE
jgi:hypothetical protein